MAEAGRALGPSLLLYPLKQVMKPSCERGPPSICQRGASLSVKKDKGTLRRILMNRPGSVSPSLLHLTHTPRPTAYFPPLSTLGQTSQRSTQVFLCVFASLRRLPRLVKCS